jgi:alpha-tubulin suppressor-like RCC1 family protein
MGLLGGVEAIAACGLHTCALANGAVQCWGDDAYGDLGNGSMTPSAVPVPASVLDGGVVTLAVGQVHACALANGGVWCWGWNAHGQLGNGSTTDSAMPVPVGAWAP